MRSWTVYMWGAVLASGALAAEDGKVLYETFCGACHAPDGRGINDGQFPPLAGSPWVQGKPDRMVQAVLHGLQGPIEVGDREYNLVMPPQGAALTDEQLAAIVTHVRGSWGHRETPVSVEEIRAQRAATAERKEMWESSDLLKAYPLPRGGNGSTPVENLVMSVYEGPFQSLEQLFKAKLAAVEEEHDGVLRIDRVGRTENFGLVWEGEVTAPEDGEYTFHLDSDDGSAVWVDGEMVVELDRVGPAGTVKTGSVKLSAGKHALRVAYFEFAGQEALNVGWSGPGLRGTSWFTPRRERRRGGRPSSPSIPIVPPPGEAVIYRNFIEGTTPRGIGVGYDGGVNLAFSADTLAVELIWTGAFMDGGRHWTDRGTGNAAPAGSKVLKLSKGPGFAVLESQTTAWPDRYQEALQPRFRGYMFNARQEPTFYYNLGSIEVADRPEARNGVLVRTIALRAPAEVPDGLTFRVAEGWPLTALDSGWVDLGGQAVVEVKSMPGAAEYIHGGQELRVPVVFKDGTATLILTYTWN